VEEAFLIVLQAEPIQAGGAHFGNTNPGKADQHIIGAQYMHWHIMHEFSTCAQLPLLEMAERQQGIARNKRGGM
jgi:hypothetical protein